MTFTSSEGKQSIPVWARVPPFREEITDPIHTAFLKHLLSVNLTICLGEKMFTADTGFLIQLKPCSVDLRQYMVLDHKKSKCFLYTDSVCVTLKTIWTTSIGLCYLSLFPVPTKLLAFIQVLSSYTIKICFFFFFLGSSCLKWCHPSICGMRISPCICPLTSTPLWLIPFCVKQINSCSQFHKSINFHIKTHHIESSVQVSLLLNCYNNNCGYVLF